VQHEATECTESAGAEDRATLDDVVSASESTRGASQGGRGKPAVSASEGPAVSEPARDARVLADALAALDAGDAETARTLLASLTRGSS
jgi:hypothetical protein